jgi:hypothetical protein
MRARGGRTGGRTVTRVLSGVMLVAGSALIAGVVFAPTALEKFLGEAQLEIRTTIHGWVSPDALPEITLGVEGGMRELDWCNGQFIEMVSYRTEDVLPLYAAHNNCGGDVILALDVGDRIAVTGSDAIYEVVEERHTPKWSNVRLLEGMTGEFMVQTCYYGVNRMRFLALQPVAAG